MRRGRWNGAAGSGPAILSAPCNHYLCASPLLGAPGARVRAPPAMKKSGKGKKDKSAEDETTELLLRIADGAPVTAEAFARLYQTEDRCPGPPACRGSKKLTCLCVCIDASRMARQRGRFQSRAALLAPFPPKFFRRRAATASIHLLDDWRPLLSILRFCAGDQVQPGAQ